MGQLRDISTPRLRIIAFAEHHLTESYIGWLNDPEVVRYSEQRHVVNDLARCRDYFETMSRSANFFSAIEETAARRGHIGNVSVAVDRSNGLADISIMIGDRGVWGNDFGYEAWSAVLKALLDREGFRKVTGGTVAPNKAMVRIMEKSGMQPDGVRPAHYLIDNVPVDVVYFARFA